MSSAALTPVASPRAAVNSARLHLVMLLVTVCWAGNIVAVKEALWGFNPRALAQLRVIGTAVIFLLILIAKGRLGRMRFSRRGWTLIFVTSLSGVALNQFFFIGGIARSNVAHTGLIVALGPVITLGIALLAGLEPLTTWKTAGMFVAFAGVGILTVDKTAQRGGASVAGDLILLAGTVVFANYTVLMKEAARQYDPLTLNTVIFTLGAVLLLPVCARPLISTHWAAIGIEAWLALGFVVLLGSVLPYSLFAYALTGISASRAAAFNYLQPVIASSLAAWLLSERLTVKALVGGALILIGVYLTERDREEEYGEKNRTYSG